MDPEGPAIVAGTVPGPATVKPWASPKPTPPNKFHVNKLCCLVCILTVLPTKPCPSPREGPTTAECLAEGPIMAEDPAEGPTMVAP